MMFTQNISVIYIQEDDDILTTCYVENNTKKNRGIKD